MKDAVGVCDVLLDERTVEPVLSAERRDLLVCGVIAERRDPGSAGMTCEIANVTTETPIITAAIPTIRRNRKPRNRTARPGAYLVIEAKSNHPMGFQAKPFTFERSPNSSVG